MSKFKLGQIIRLKSYEQYYDYKQHRNETAVIDCYIDGFNYRIKWKDNTISHVHKSNITLAYSHKRITQLQEELTNGTKTNTI